MNAKDSLDEAGHLHLPEPQYRSHRRLDRLGVVDVGSNSVRLVVFDGAARSPAYFFNEKILCGLGAGVSETGRLNPEGRERALAALRRFALLAENMECEPLYCIATAAVREAKDGAAFIKDVRRKTGLDLVVASGEEEARLSAQGVLLGWPEAEGLMCDIGGSSMELARISGGTVGQCMTSPLGPLKLARFGESADLQAEIARNMETLRDTIREETATLFLVGGSWRAIARLDMERRAYPLKVLHEYKMTPEGLLKTVDWIGTQTVDDMRAMIGSSLERMRLVPVAARVLKELIGTFQPAEIAASSYGIREGLLYEQMPENLRRRDPLIEACLHMERASARNPGFGEILAHFLEPLFKDQSSARKRLIRAACLLHDVTWRAHPDYRAEVCFDNATRANLGGLDHAGRVFLGLALLHRYKNSIDGSSLEAVTSLLDEEQRRMAQIVGKAMRFGAMLSGAARSTTARLKYRRKQAVIELILKPRSRDLFGEVVKNRFESLASSMNCTTKVTVE